MLSAALLALSAAFLIWRVSTPAECAYVTPEVEQWSDSGVRPAVLDGCPLAAGSLVTSAVTGADNVILSVQGDGGPTEIVLPVAPPTIAGRFVDAWSTMLFVASLFAVSCYAFLRRRSDPACGALLVLSSALLGSTAVTVVGIPAHAAFGGGPLWLYLLNVSASYSIGWGALLLFAALFPAMTARLQDHPERRLAIGALPVMLVVAGATMVGATSDGGFGSPGWVRATFLLVSVVVVLAIVAALVLLGRLALRLRRTRFESIERQQLLWVGGSAPPQPFWCSRSGWSRSWSPARRCCRTDAIGLPGLIFVAGLTVALLRYRLFDLETLLGRTLVYSASDPGRGRLYLGCGRTALRRCSPVRRHTDGGGRRRRGRDRSSTRCG